MAIKGCDISRYQGRIAFDKVRKDGIEFAIQKCTQGVDYIDPTYQTNKNGARNNGVLFGSYHFANGGDPIKEAQWFVKCVGDIREGELLALDWEINHANPITWCKKFLDEVSRLVGFKPLLYTNSARLYAHDWSPIINSNYGLWVANYGLNICTTLGREPKIGGWQFYALWQYCSRGSVDGIAGNVDMNYTKMDISTLKKYGKTEVACTKCCPKHCN